ncbi:MAG: chorismate synthase [Clostridia bacterium]
MRLTNSGLKLDVYGESHGEFIGMTLSGVPLGESVDGELLQEFVDRRRAGGGVFSTTRREPDKIIILSGIEGGITTGGVIEARINNTQMRSKDYDNLKNTPRPSHADYPAFVKYGGKLNMSGGGKFSGRLTAPLCIAGGIAAQILSRHGITVGAYIAEIGGIKGASYRERDINADDLIRLKGMRFPVLDDNSGEKMLDAIAAAKGDLDSLGGIVEGVAVGVPAGWGDAMYGSIESALSSLLFGIPAIKGVEFGAGFDITRMRGSEANDPYYYDANGNVKTKSNNNGGILGGITNGMPVLFRAAVKPTPSISKPQDTVDLAKKTNTQIVIKGRHDVCIVPRAAIAIEAALALTLLDALYSQEGASKNE